MRRNMFFYYFLGVRIKSLQNKFSILVGLGLHNVFQLREDRINKKFRSTPFKAMQTSLLP